MFIHTMGTRATHMTTDMNMIMLINATISLTMCTNMGTHMASMGMSMSMNQRMVSGYMLASLKGKNTQLQPWY
jgi:hypothetical protein